MAGGPINRCPCVGKDLLGLSLFSSGPTGCVDRETGQHRRAKSGPYRTILARPPPNPRRS